DRRRALLRLSPAGQAIHDEVGPHARGFEERLLDGMPEAERALLLGLLDRLDELELRAEAAAVGWRTGEAPGGAVAVAACTADACLRGSYGAPCLRRGISGATRPRITPPINRIQKPCV